MKNPIDTQHLPRMWTILILWIALSVTCFAQTKPAAANDGKKENTESAWKVQAQSVCAEAGLTKDQSARIMNAYLEARKSHKQALKELPEEKDKDKSRAATQAVVEKDRASFVKSLKSGVPEDVIAKILPTLGSFNTKWDGFVVALQDLNLDPATMKSAMKLVITYVTDYEAASVESMKSFNRKPNSRQYKQTLDAGLTSILSADQLAQWKEATASSSGKDTGTTSKEKSTKGKKK